MGDIFSFILLHDLGHEVAHGFCCLNLNLPGGVGVGAEGEACVIVTQHTADGLDIYSVLESQRRECVPLRHIYDNTKNPVIARVSRFLSRVLALIQGQKNGLKSAKKTTMFH